MEPFSVCWAKVFYTDKPGWKVRPVVSLGRNTYVFLKVTSVTTRKGYHIKNLDVAKLSYESVVLLDSTYTIKPWHVYEEWGVNLLSKDDVDGLVEAIREHGPMEEIINMPFEERQKEKK